MEFDMMKGKFSNKDARQLNPLVLAFVGDAIYEIFIRTYLVDVNRDMSVHKLHKKAIGFVKANAQSNIMMKLLSDLNDEEEYIYKRGRNAKSGTVPKNADVVEYRTATGFEALVGYLYLTEQNERLNEMLEKVIELSKCNE